MRSFCGLWIRRWLRESGGQDLIEYALLAGFVSLAAFGGAGRVGEALDGWYDVFAGSVSEKTEQTQIQSDTQGPRTAPDTDYWEEDPDDGGVHGAAGGGN